MKEGLLKMFMDDPKERDFHSGIRHAYKNAPNDAKSVEFYVRGCLMKIGKKEAKEAIEYHNKLKETTDE